MKKKKGKKKEKDPDKPKPKIEVNFKDGVTWHDFVGFFVLIGKFFWRIVRIVFSPIFWIYGENVRMIRFVRARGHERVMSDDERMFVETIPFVYTVTGLFGGIILGIFAAFSWQDVIIKFFEGLNLDFFSDIFGVIGAIIGWLFKILVIVVVGIFTFISFIFNTIFQAFLTSPFLGFGGMVLLGIIVMLIWLVINETGLLDSVYVFLSKIFIWLVGSPERFRLRVNTIYRKINHRLTAILVGKERLHTRTHVFFKKSALYTIVLSFYSFAVGIFVGVDPKGKWGELDTEFSKIAFTSLVLFIAGVVAGTLFFALMTRVLDLLNRKKYISPEFIREDGVYDRDAMKSLIAKDEERFNMEMEKQEAKAKEMAEKQIKEMEQRREDRRKEREAGKPASFDEGAKTIAEE